MELETWHIIVISVGGGWALLWLLINLKTSRPDGTFLNKVHPYRRMMAYLMPGRNESVVYFDDYVKADALLDYIGRTRKDAFHVDVTHCLVAAVGMGMRYNPKMNQFIAGQRIYQRNHVAVTFSMKRQKGNRRAKITAVKQRIEEEQTFADICATINKKIGYERSDAKTYTDKELGLFFKFPRPLLRGSMSLVRWLDYHNLLPKAFIDSDGFFTSAFIANLGSVGMRPGFHHLYEYGTCPLFVMVGRIEKRPTVVGDEIQAVNTLHIRFSYDERIDDGLTARFGIDTVREILEDPDRYLGTWDADGRTGGDEPLPIPPSSYNATADDALAASDA